MEFGSDDFGTDVRVEASLLTRVGVFGFVGVRIKSDSTDETEDNVLETLTSELVSLCEQVGASFTGIGENFSGGFTILELEMNSGATGDRLKAMVQGSIWGANLSPLFPGISNVSDGGLATEAAVNLDP